MNTELIDHLKTLGDIDVDTHSGSYELIRQGVARLGNVAPEDIDVSDLEMLFHFGNLRHGKQARDKNIADSHLSEEDKKYLTSLNGIIATATREYSNSGLDNSHQSNGNCGLFSKGRQTLIGVSDKESAQSFIAMLIAISKMPPSSADMIYQIVAECLSKKMKGIGVGIASQMLHLLKPYLFPILNSIGQSGYKKLGLSLVKAGSIASYIENVKIIDDFKKTQLPDINFRTIDVALWSAQGQKKSDNNHDNHSSDTSNYDKYGEEDFLCDVYISSERYKTLKGLLLRKKNVILQGAPGVGKTYAAERLAYSIMGEKNTDRVKSIQFHQSYSYEDFVMGWRPEANGFKLEEGPFYRFCKAAETGAEDEPFFFVIDEINRGNLSKIFGELLMLIEGDKRGYSIGLLYKDEQFSVPKNLHIIGTMNTADRSLAMIDYALRRRFAFFDMPPAFQSEGFKSYQKNIGNDKFDDLIAAVERLNADIGEDGSLGDGFRIGHSYFCVDKEKVVVDDNWLSDVVEYELIPLLGEYWFDEPKKCDEWSKRLRDAIDGR